MNQPSPVKETALTKDLRNSPFKEPSGSQLCNGFWSHWLPTKRRGLPGWKKTEQSVENGANRPSHIGGVGSVVDGGVVWFSLERRYVSLLGSSTPGKRDLDIFGRCWEVEDQLFQSF